MGVEGGRGVRAQIMFNKNNFKEPETALFVSGNLKVLKHPNQLLQRSHEHINEYCTIIKNPNHL